MDRLLRSLLVVVLVFAAAGCGDGEDPGTVDRPRADSVNASVGALRLLATRIETPQDTVHVAGGNVGLFLTVANSGSTADTLTAASTVDARKIVFRDGSGPVADVRVEIPPGGVVSMQYPGGPHLELVDLRKDVGGGRFMPVTFRFAGAGVTTVNVFVQGFAHPTVSPPSPSAP